MKKKTISARFLVGILSAVTVIGAYAPTIPVLAQEDSAAAVMDVTTEDESGGTLDNQETVQYVLMNIPYDDFYSAEVENDVTVDAFTSATLNKTRTGSLAAGSYHVDSQGTDITGITYPVKLGDGVSLANLSGYTQITDESSVDITVTNKGNTTATTYTGKEALFESASYSYYILTDTPDYYKEVTFEDGKPVFGKAQATKEKKSLENVEYEFTTDTTYGDYQLNLTSDELSKIDTIYGVVINTSEGESYGLRHMENIWRNVNLAWGTGFTTSVHNCPVSSAHYASMMGKTITGLTYYTSDGIYEITLANEIYVPVKFESELSVENASVSSGQTTIQLTGLPSDYNAAYAVEGLENVSVSGNKLSFQQGAKNGAYTLKVTDSNSKYASITASFELYADTMPASYDEQTKSIVAADGATSADLQDYIKNISSVSVNGRSYAASGKGSVVIINNDGTIKTDAEPLKEAGDYKISITATGYQNPLTFTYTKDAAYQYVYAALTWAEYWEAEGVYAAGSAKSSTETDTKGELDKGAFDTVSRATTNHGLHRGSYQCTAVITLKNGTTLNVAYYTGQTEGILTNGETFSYNKNDIVSYEVTGIKYVPVKVATEDYEAFKALYTVVENGGSLSGGYTENNLQNYVGILADVSENTNGLKTAVKNADGTFSFSARATNGTESGIKDQELQKASGIIVNVKEASGSYGEFLRVDLTGEYGGLAANMQAVKWTYYGNDSTYTNALQSYGTKFAADNWMHKQMGIQLGLTESLRCQLPEGYDGTGYWSLTVYALGYEDYTTKFEVKESNIVASEKEESIDTTELANLITQAQQLKEADYTAETWANLKTELAEAIEEASAKHSQAAVTEAVTHLKNAMDALVKKTVSTEEVTVKDPSVTLKTSSATVQKGKTTKIEIESKYPADDTVKSCVSSNTKIATVTDEGVVTGVQKGTATITVTMMSGATATFKVTVKNPSVTLEKTSATVQKGKTTKIELKSNYPANDTVKSYVSSNKKIATVTDKGVVKGIKKGTATITVTMKSGAKATFKVTVKNPSVTLKKTAVSVKVGKTVKIQIKSKYPTTDSVKKFSSSNKKVATVTSKGVVKGIKKGTTTITVTMKSGAKASCKVTVK